MIFDPFNDFAVRGYLRNVVEEKDLEIIKRLEHNSFLTGIDDAFNCLSQVDRLSYNDVLDTHKTLFEAIYPWAGQDRAQIAPDIAVSRGSILFVHPRDARIAVEHALKLGHDKDFMTSKSGEVMGYLAYAHPFLDGNGRTIMVIHTELAQRAGISLDWATTNKAEYLTALTREIESPGRGHLDSYLEPFIHPAVGHARLASHVTRIRGLGADYSQLISADEVSGRFSDPALQARYKAQEQHRKLQINSASPGSVDLSDSQAIAAPTVKARHAATKTTSFPDWTAEDADPGATPADFPDYTAEDRSEPPKRTDKGRSKGKSLPRDRGQ